MSNELWVAFCGFLTTVGGSFATWFFTRKKYNSEVDSQVIANMKDALEFWKDESSATKTRLNELISETKELRIENAKLQEGQYALRVENVKLQNDVNGLRDEVATAMKTICYDFSCAHRIKTSAEAQKVVKNIKKAARQTKTKCEKKDA